MSEYFEVSRLGPHARLVELILGAPEKPSHEAAERIQGEIRRSLEAAGFRLANWTPRPIRSFKR